MITPSQAALLLGGIALVYVFLALTYRTIGERIERPETGPVRAGGYWLLAFIIVVALVGAGLWWSAQFQPGGYFLP